MDGAGPRPHARADRRRRASVQRSAKRRIGVELCRAVAAVHAAGLLHRDIKATNVMLDDDGRVVLMDFGTGQDLDDSGVRLSPARRSTWRPSSSRASAATRAERRLQPRRAASLSLTGTYPVQAETAALRKTVSRKLSRIIERDRSAAGTSIPDGRLVRCGPGGAVKRPSFAPMAYLTAVVAAALLGPLGDPESRRRTAGASARPPGRCRRPALTPRRAAVREHQRRAGQRGIG